MSSRPASNNSKRPSSTSSRSAWNDDGLDAPGRPDSSGSSVSDIKPDPVPAPAAKSERKRRPRKKKRNCCEAIIHTIWSTRYTEEMEDNEAKAKTMLRELIIYLIFLIILCAITFGMTSSNMYTMTKVLTDLFVDSQFPDTKNTFRGMLTQTDFWRFAESSLVDGLYWEEYYNQQNVSQNDLGYLYYENKLLGVPRLRQLRVNNESCTVDPMFNTTIPECYGEYSKKTNDEASYGPAVETAWVFHSVKEMNGSSHTGELTSYPGSGFYQDLAKTKAETKVILADLRENRWIDRGTRVVFLDFTVYNPNINLFTVIRMVVEYPPTGGAISSFDFRTVKLLRYVTIGDFIILGCEIVFCAFVLYYLLEEAMEIKSLGKVYFNEFWNMMDIIVITMGLVCIAFNVYRGFKVGELLESLLNAPEEFADFEILSYWQVHFNYGLALMTFFAWAKIFKYISFNKTMTQLTDTLARSKGDLVGFMVMFGIFMFAFAQLGYLFFGSQLRDYSTPMYSFLTLMRIILGDFDFHALEAAHGVLGPLFFFMYIFLVYLVLINMFLAIINDSYSVVKADSVNAPNEFEVMDFFKNQYNRMLEKLNVKRDKINDIQEAIRAADMNNDSLIEYEEWKNELLVRGYKEKEIEEAFKKFDKDGNRVLDAEEQKAMLSELEKEKNAVDQDIGKVETKLGVNDRPVTGRPGTTRPGTRGKTARGKRGNTASGEDKPPTRGGRKAPKVVSEVAYAEFTQLSRRVDRMEHSIGSIVSKIDTVLVKLEGMEKAKLKRREAMTQMLDSIAESGDATEEMKREQMERLVREELQRWDSESAVSRPGSAISMISRPGTSARSRPSSSMK